MLIVLLVILQVIVLDGILSIDNIAALSALARKLPRKQQKDALRVGIIGAYTGRGLMLFIISWLLQNPWIKLVGATYLLYLTACHFFHWDKWEPQFKGINNFWKTVIMIEIADITFSVDNVAAIVGLSQNTWIIVVGMGISMIIMRYAAQLFLKLIRWEPNLEHAAYLLIAAIGIELILDWGGFMITQLEQFLLSVMIILGTVLISKYKVIWGGEDYE